MKTAACYIRVSTDVKLEYSPTGQLEKIKEFAAHYNMLLPEKNIFIEEEGVSGRNAEKREEFQRMIAAAKSKEKPQDKLYDYSQFFRRPSHFAKILPKKIVILNNRPAKIRRDCLKSLVKTKNIFG